MQADGPLARPDSGAGAPGAGTDPEAKRSEEWRAILTARDPSMIRIRRLWSLVPSDPRCKFCNSPFRGPGRLLTRLFMHGQSNQNPMLCNACFKDLAHTPGGAEVEATILFADIRGSTGIAEQVGTIEFRRHLQAFYSAAAGAIDRNGGMVDKYLGDGVMALFYPAIAGENHAARGIAAARDLIRAAERVVTPAGPIRAGVGLHSGPAFLGVLGSGDRLDFSALGDTVNVAARLGSLAGAGELLASRDTWTSADIEPEPGAATRRVPIAGREHDLEVVAEAADPRRVPA